MDLPLAQIEKINKLANAFEQHLLTAYAIAHLAAQVRDAQKTYYRSRKGEDLVAAKCLEKQLDDRLVQFFR